MENHSAQTERVTSNAAVVWMCLAIIIGGFIFGISYVFKKVKPDLEREKVGVIRRLENDLEATERSGKTVRLGELQGKVYLVAYIYTSCPRSCPGVVASVKEVAKKFESNPNFHVVMVSVHSSAEPPELLQSFAKAHEIDKPNWWFLTGDEPTLRKYMTKQVGMEQVRDIPEKERISPADLFEHDARVALIDDKANVRSMYQVMNADEGIRQLVMEKLEKDLAAVLAEAAESKK